MQNSMRLKPDISAFSFSKPFFYSIFEFFNNRYFMSLVALRLKGHEKSFFQGTWKLAKRLLFKFNEIKFSIMRQ